MLHVSLQDVECILMDFGIDLAVSSVSELERCDDEMNCPESKKVRLILKAVLTDGSSIVLRLKNEADVTQELLEQQGWFAELIRQNGVSCPEQYKAGEAFSKRYSLNGYDVLVTVEEFVEGEVTCVTPEIAAKAGSLLGQCHNIAEQFHAHVASPVLFNPFSKNELFDFSSFASIGGKLTGEELALHQNIVKIYKRYQEILSPLRMEPCYAVQGDFSDCNLYLQSDGTLGLFDFNRCGDNHLFCDAVMQGVFFSRLMVYPDARPPHYSKILFPIFLNHYQKKRPFSALYQRLLPYLYSIIDAFWSADIVWNEDSLLKAQERGDTAAVQKWLKVVQERLGNLSGADC